MQSSVEAEGDAAMRPFAKLLCTHVVVAAFVLFYFSFSAWHCWLAERKAVWLVPLVCRRSCLLEIRLDLLTIEHMMWYVVLWQVIWSHWVADCRWVWFVSIVKLSSMKTFLCLAMWQRTRHVPDWPTVSVIGHCSPSLCITWSVSVTAPHHSSSAPWTSASTAAAAVTMTTTITLMKGFRRQRTWRCTGRQLKSVNVSCWWQPMWFCARVSQLPHLVSHHQPTFFRSVHLTLHCPAGCNSLDVIWSTVPWGPWVVKLGHCDTFYCAIRAMGCKTMSLWYVLLCHKSPGL